MARKNPEVTKETVRRIKEAFWSLYEEKPVEKISVREITAKAGYNHATFYLYFQNVRDVLTRIENDLLETRDVLLTKATHNGTLDFSEKNGFKGLLALMGSDFLPYAKVLLGPHGDPAFAEQAKDRMWPYLEPLIFPRSKKAQNPVPGSPKYELSRQFYLSGILGAIKTIVIRSNDLSPEDVVDFVQHEVLRGR
ncbi:MAG: TetR/AcrR family transcriptional regulator [Bifidobacteriaceae bacterium]|jgi:AcrR family transcriptional regulator|nr:TetR/AcrR family transcriptional regulator [Bifidobacteriaceae bacterium]